MTNDYASLQAQFSWLARLLSGCDGLVLTPSALTFKAGNAKRASILISELKTFPELKRGLLGYSLSLEVPQHGTLRVPFLPSSNTKEIAHIIAQLSAHNLATEANQALNTFRRLAVHQYLRQSDEAKLIAAVTPMVKRFPLIRESVCGHWTKSLMANMDRLCGWAPFDQANLRQLRERYVNDRRQTRKAFYDKVESNPLTEQQRLAVIRNDDFNLVLAAAGTGKTSVMVAKALDLIESGEAKPEDVLVLAFNRDAAKELGERAQKRASVLGLKDEQIPAFFTFHALGRQIVRESGRSVSLSPMAEHNSELNRWLDRFIKSYLKAGRLPIDKFARLAFSPVDPHSFTSTEEYKQYLSDNAFITLRGQKVRGYQEVLIANWLIIHRIPFEYEARYPLDPNNPEENFDYRPDFYLTQANIYLEHFGIDRDGSTRRDIDAELYRLRMEQKRRLHERHGTTLIETYHYNWKEGTLESRLADLMNEHGVPMNPMTQDEVIEELSQAKIYSNLLNEFLQCMLCIRREHFSEHDVERRLAKNGLPEPKFYAHFLMDLVRGYEAELRDNDHIDYDDMINLAIDAMESGRYRPRWQHILVDEFQDISDSRLRFLKALLTHGPQPRFTAVGDDWQAIYRFAGGNLKLTTDFTHALGTHTLTKIETTYRYNQGIADVAGHFVMANPDQYRKSVTSKIPSPGQSVVVVDNCPEEENDDTGFKGDDLATCQTLIREIRERDPDARIAIINRYNEPLKSLKRALRDPDIQFWTCHGSKGLEADYCLITGLRAGYSGFPSKKRANAVLEALLPEPGLYPDGEERRLFYVAMTRAKKTCYLIMDPKYPSGFVLELRHHPAVTWESNHLTKSDTQTQRCPRCKFGTLVERVGPFGPYLECSRHPYCQTRGSVKSGKLSTSNAPTRVCEVCGGTMRIRSGKKGDFWGCDGYWNKTNPCRNTHPVRKS